MDPSTASTRASTTVISDLNDDCLLETVEHLDLINLCSIANISRRFRHIAQRRFASLNKTLVIYCDSGHLSLRTLLITTRDNSGREHHLIQFVRDLPRYCAYEPMFGNRFENPRGENFSIRSDGDSLSQKLLNISKFLRIFGMEVKNIYIPSTDPVLLTRHKKSIFDLIGLHCGPQLVGLTLEHREICTKVENTGIFGRPYATW